MTMTPIVSLFECLVPSEWNSLGRIRSCRVVERNVSLGMGFEVLKGYATLRHTHSLSLSFCLQDADQDVKLSNYRSRAMFASCHIMNKTNPLKL